MANPLDELTAYGWATWVFVGLLSIWSGTANFLRKLQKGVVRPFNITEWFGEMLTCTLAGFITFLLCQYAEYSIYLTIPLVSIASHHGARVIYLMEKQLEKKAKSMGFDVQEDSQTQPGHDG